MLTRLVSAGLIGVTLLAAPAQPARAWGGGGGFAFGTVFGLGTGLIIGSAISRPAYAYPYPVYAYPYPYYAPAPVYAAPYAYPSAVYAPPPRPYAPAYYPAPTPAPAQPPARTPNCGPGRFFNTLTGTCDR